VIPAKTVGHVDTRALTVSDWQETYDRIMALEPIMPGAKVKVSFVNGHKPMEHDAQMIRSFAQCKRIGEAYGLTIREDGSGGASDGNTVAAMGIPVLDGLGPQGDGLHALHEHVVLNSMPRRATLLAAMLKEWQFDV